MVTKRPKSQIPKSLPPSSDESDAQKITILYGSNTGTCETLSQKLVADCAMHRFQAGRSSTGSLPSDRPVVIITASYEGEPPDNAIHFVEWLTNLNS